MLLDDQISSKSLKSSFTPSPPRTPPLGKSSPNIEGGNTPQLPDDEKSLTLPSESSIDPNFIEEYNKSLMEQNDEEKTVDSPVVQSPELTDRLEPGEDSNSLNSALITPVLVQSPLLSEESSLGLAPVDIEQDFGNEKSSSTNGDDLPNDSDGENLDSNEAKRDDDSSKTNGKSEIKIIDY